MDTHPCDVHPSRLERARSLCQVLNQAEEFQLCHADVSRTMHLCFQNYCRCFSGSVFLHFPITVLIITLFSLSSSSFSVLFFLFLLFFQLFCFILLLFHSSSSFSSSSSSFSSSSTSSSFCSPSPCLSSLSNSFSFSFSSYRRLQNIFIYITKKACSVNLRHIFDDRLYIHVWHPVLMVINSELWSLTRLTSLRSWRTVCTTSASMGNQMT